MSQEKAAEKSAEEKMSTRFNCSRNCCLTLCVLILFTALTTFILTADALYKFSYVTSLLGTNVFVYGVVVLLFVSFFSLLITPAMLYALITKNQSLFTMLTFTTLSIGSMGILAAILGFCLHAEVNFGKESYPVLRDDSLRRWMSEGLRREYGHPQDYSVTNAWDQLQSEMKCCGVDSEAEWIASDWYLGQVKYPRRRRPGSCCRSCSDARERICKFQFFESMSTAERRTCDLLSTLCPASASTEVDGNVCSGNQLGHEELPVDAFVHSEGCFSLLETRLRFYAIVLIVEGILLATLLFSQTISAFALNYYADPLLGSYDAVNTVE